MKNYKLYWVLFLGICWPALSWAQSDDQIAVPLSKPGEPGTLMVHTLMGSIDVEAYEGKEVVIRYSNLSSDHHKPAPREVDGMKRVSNNSLGLEVKEDNNEVLIKVNSFGKRADLKIMVPKNFSLSLKTVNDGTIRVSGVQGDMDISNMNGSIYLKQVAGSAAVNTLNGNIEAEFTRLNGNEELFFTNLNGKIKLVLPASSKFELKAKAQFGEIYTDFDMKMKRETTRNQSTSSDGMFHVKVDEWIQGAVNGGGAEVYLKSLNGNIYIKKK